ncbi:MAG: hypothetical protein JWR89_1534 [Tardiphaga sp.]|jgi:hypothetical protein|nr:hypothetical protein [Tardiphaga sp.]
MAQYLQAGERPMTLADQELVIDAIETARSILGQYTGAGPRDAIDALEQLQTVMDNTTLVAALDRLKRRQRLRLVE